MNESAALAQAIMGLPVGEEEVSELASRRRPRELQYWKLHNCGPMCGRHKNRKGWVTTGPVLNPHTAVEYTNFMESKHAKPLDKAYGVDAGRNGEVPGSGYLYDGPTRFLPLIQNGGLKEFPDEQLIAYGWHRIPAVREARPHLANIVDIYCEYGCPPNRVYSSEASYQRHIKAHHGDAAGARAVGKQFQEILANQTGGMIDPVAMAAAIAQAVMQFEMTRVEPTVPEPTPVEEKLSNSFKLGDTKDDDNG